MSSETPGWPETAFGRADRWHEDEHGSRGSELEPEVDVHGCRVCPSANPHYREAQAELAASGFPLLGAPAP